MRAFYPVLLLLLFSLSAFSQASDFVTVKKKNNRTYATYFPGSSINCMTLAGYYLNGTVDTVRNDSVFVRQYDIRVTPTTFGVTRIDTMGTYVLGIHYKEIDVVVVPRKESFTYVKNGSIFMIGGLGYALLNLVNGKYLKQSITNQENLRSLGIALGTAGFGYLLNRLHETNNRNGKKYVVEYVHMQGKPIKGV